MRLSPPLPTCQRIRSSGTSWPKRRKVSRQAAAWRSLVSTSVPSTSNRIARGREAGSAMHGQPPGAAGVASAAVGGAIVEQGPVRRGGAAEARIMAYDPLDPRRHAHRPLAAVLAPQDELDPAADRGGEERRGGKAAHGHEHASQTFTKAFRLRGLAPL